MEDLLRDDDFVVKEYFNHWKYFRKCYFIAIGCLLGVTLMVGILDQFLSIDASFVGLAMFVAPLFIVAFMIFGQKKLLQVSFSTVALGLFFLLCVFYVPLSLIIISEGGYSEAIAVFAIFSIVPLAIIMPVFNWRQKRMSK